MEIFGSDFSDEFFESEKSSKAGSAVKETWTPHLCEPEWFKEFKETDSASSSNENSLNDATTLNVLHFHANHLYFTSKYMEASEIFSKLLQLASPTNFQLRREVCEGLSRSLMKIGKLDEALIAAKEFELSCKSKTHFTTGHVLYAEIYTENQNYSKALNYWQIATMSHQLNSNLWLKIAECYGLLHNFDVYSALFKLSKVKDSTWHAAASVIRADIILKTVAGGPETIRKKRIQQILQKIQPCVENLPPAFVSKAREALCRDVYNWDNQRENSEFQDLGSSKIQQSTDCEDNVPEKVMDDQEDWFENHWFQFENKICESDLDSILSVVE